MGHLVQHRRRRIRWLFKPLLASCAFLLALLFGELIVRFCFPAPAVKPIHLASEACVYKRSTNPLLGFELKPSYRNDNPDFIQSYERTNSHGQRDEERQLAKPSGTRRILLLGDSVVEGYGLPEDQTISQQLELLYQGEAVEVSNFGVSAYCTLAEIELLATKGVAFEPDTVVLVFVENDFDNFNREAFPLNGTIDRPRWAETMFLRSHLFRLACLQGNLFHFGLTESDPVQWNQNAIGDNNVVDGLRRFQKLSRQYGFRPLVAIWPQFQDDAIADVHFMPGSDVLIVEKLARASGLPTTRLSAAFVADLADRHSHGNPRLLYSQGDKLHPSAAGAAVAAKAIRSALELPAASLPPETESDAVAAAAELGQTKPSYVRVHNRIGGELFRAGRFEEALAHLEKAIEEDATHAGAHNNMGITLEKLERPGAKKCFIKAVELQHDFALAHFNLSRILRKEGRTRAALMGFQRVLQLDPNHVGANYHVGAMLAQQRKSAEAIPHLERVIALDPSHAEARSDLGVVLATMGRYEAALDQFRSALSLQPDHARARKNLASTLELMNSAK